MFKKYGWIILVMMMAACSQDEKASQTTPEYPTATAQVILNYSGPLLPGSDLETSCSEESACSALPNVTELIDIAPDDLTLETIGKFNVDVPTGYSSLVLADEAIISATSTDTVGGYIFSLREVDDTTLNQLLKRFGEPDLSSGKIIEHPTLVGTWLPTEDYGAIALLENEDGQMIFIEASSDPAYWGAFEAVFMAMLQSVTFAV